MHFNAILGQLRKHDPRSNQETLRVHLKKMLEQEIVERDPYTGPGKKRYYWLSPMTKFQMDWNTFTGIEDVKLKKISNGESVREKKKKVKKLVLILLLALGSDAYFERVSPRPQAGDRLAMDCTGKRVLASGNMHPGFSPKDLNKYNVDGSLALFPKFLSRYGFTESEIQSKINVLLEHQHIPHKTTI